TMTAALETTVRALLSRLARAQHARPLRARARRGGGGAVGAPARQRLPGRAREALLTLAPVCS
ncbi:MAG: hypothetical protein M3Y87_35630, partial [Myxococcota bacterium]|nr:hypothetical protein [Myxococcota bacterium]